MSDEKTVHEKVLFFCKYSKGRYDYSSPEDLKKGITRVAQFVNHHLMMEVEDANLLSERNQNYNKHFWKVRAYIPMKTIVENSTMSLGQLTDAGLVQEQALAEASKFLSNPNIPTEFIDGDKVIIDAVAKARKYAIDTPVNTGGRPKGGAFPKYVRKKDVVPTITPEEEELKKCNDVVSALTDT